MAKEHLMTESVLFLSDDICSWAIPESVELVTQLLRVPRSGVRIVSLEETPEIAFRTKILVPVLFSPVRPTTAQYGSVIVARPEEWLLAGFNLPSEQVIRQSPEDLKNMRNADSVSAYSPDEQCGFSCLIRSRQSGSPLLTIILLGEERQAVASMERLIAREFALGEGAQWADEAMLAVASLMPSARPTDQTMQRLIDTAAAALAWTPQSSITISRDERGGVKTIIERSNYDREDSSLSAQ